MSGIRTPRGRSAAYRVLWQWPLRSPRRALGCIAIVAVLAIALNMLAGALTSPSSTGAPADQRAAAGTSAPTAPTPALSPGLPARPTGTAPPATRETPQPGPGNGSGADEEGARDAAARWVAAWSENRSNGMRRWLDGLDPLTTEQYLSVLGTVDLANLPDAPPVGGEDGVDVISAGGRSAVVDVHLEDESSIRLSLVRASAGWLVSNAEPVVPT